MTMESFFTFNAGNVATLLGGLISVVVLWQKLSDKVDSLTSRITRQEGELDQLTKMGLMTTIAQHERRLVEVESVAKDIRGIQSDIGWIKNVLYRNKEDQHKE